MSYILFILNIFYSSVVSSLEHAPTVDDCSKCIAHKVSLPITHSPLFYSLSQECRPVDGPHSRPFHCICPNDYIMKNCSSWCPISLSRPTSSLSEPACLRARSDDGSIIKCVIPKSILTHRPDECSEYVQKKSL